jgi:putative hydrolase of the HAD superfamily
MGQDLTFEVLLFDLGGVLVDFAGFEKLGRLLPDAPDAATIRQRWINSEPVHHFESGAISSREFSVRFVAEWNLALSPEDFLREFSSWPRGLYPGAGRLLLHLRKIYRLASLSNSNELHTHIHRRYVEPYIDQAYFSHELGLAKPQPEIFDLVIEELACPPGRIAFFDDTAVNVQAGSSAGMKAYRVDGVEALEIQLARLGVL